MKINVVGLVSTALCAILLCVCVLILALGLEPRSEAGATPEIFHLADTIANGAAMLGIFVALLALIVGLAHSGKPSSEPKA